jgi:hypothetical protein
MKLRTLTALPCLIGVIRDSWSQGTFCVHPLGQSWSAPAPELNLMNSCPKGKHLIHLSQNWSEALRTGLVGSSTEIAEQCGLTSGRVRQIVRLSAIDPKIAEFLASLEGKAALRGFSETRIRFIVAMPREEQMSKFEEAFGIRLPS